MTTLREAVAQALDALTKIHPGNMSWETGDAWLNAVQILREALAQPEPEPVAIVVAAEYEDGSHAGHRLEWRGRNEANDYPEGTEFYITTPQRKPLTDEEIAALLAQSAGVDLKLNGGDLLFARAIERAHGIGEKE